jgi:peptidyl-prolyl cis-trans isomerase D
MFDFVRNHTRLALGFMLLLIIPSFVFFGVEGYSRFNDGTAASVAKVDGRNISRAEWDNAHQRNVDRVRRQTPTVDVRMLDTPQMRTDTLDGLVRERVLLTAAQAMHLTPSDARIKQIFVSDPQFAQLRNPDGSVNRDILAMQGMSSEMLVEQLRQEFAMQQVLAGVTRTALAPVSIAAAALDPLLQRREVQLQRFDPAAYRSKLNPTDAEVEAYYKAQASMFKAPEQASIEYVVLDLDAMGRASVPPKKSCASSTPTTPAATPRRKSAVPATSSSRPTRTRPRPTSSRRPRPRPRRCWPKCARTPASFADLAKKSSRRPGLGAARAVTWTSLAVAPWSSRLKMPPSR